MTISVESFVSKTLQLLEKERTAEIEETRILQENVSPKELQRRGICLLKLRVSSRHTGLYGRTVIVFEPYWPAGYTGERCLPSHNFTPGDIAGVSVSKSDGNSEQLASGIIFRVTSASISVAFDESHDSLELDDDAQYKLLKLANDVTYKRLKKTLNDLNSYRSGPASSLINVLFGVSEIGPPYTLERDGEKALPDLCYNNPGLDESQREAVSFALRQREVAIVHGPPGTGKTTTVVEIIQQAVKQKLKILACAPSNIAVDNLVERLAAAKCKVVRLGHPARVLHGIQKYSLDAILASSEETKLVEDVRRDMDKTLAKLKKTRDHGGRQQLREDMRHLRKELRERETAASKTILKRADVVLATLTGASMDSGPLRLLEEGHFDLAVVDECSQALEAACWQALLQAPRCVLAGDHHQLPPTILSTQAAKEGLEVTLMERLIKQHGEAAVRMLTTQYRMNQHIMAWASQQLYKGRLTAHQSVAQHLLKDLSGIEDNENTSTPLLLIDTTGCDLTELDMPDEVSKGNEGEADIVAAHVEELVSSGLRADDIAVIAPYNLQVEFLRLRLSSKYPQLEIKSVDGFQGREKEAVVISMVRSNDKGVVGFLAEDRRINVAITRARRHLAVICDTETVGRHPFLKSLVEYMTQHGDVRSAQTYIDAGALQNNIQRPENIQSRLNDAKSKEKAQSSTKPKSGKKTKPNDSAKKQAIDKKGKVENRPQISEEEFKSREEEIRETLVEFSINDAKQQYSFSSTLTARERKTVHEVAENLNLLHISEGQGDDRYITVSKPPSNQQKKPSKQTPNLPDENSSGSSQSRNQQKHNHVKKRQGTKELTTEKCDDIEDAEKEDDEQSDIAQCSICEKLIPRTNMELHQLRCVKPQPAQHNTGAKPKNKKKKKSAKGPKEKVEEEDFDALIAAAIKDNTVCHFHKCKEYTTCLGQNCSFCGRRFCLKHHIPEVHGCGDKAKANARMVISREGVIHRGSGVPDKSVDPARRAFLERRMDKKLEEMGDKRKIKKKGKNKDSS